MVLHEKHQEVANELMKALVSSEFKREVSPDFSGAEIDNGPEPARWETEIQVCRYWPRLGHIVFKVRVTERKATGERTTQIHFELFDAGPALRRAGTQYEGYSPSSVVTRLSGLCNDMRRELASV